MSPDPEIRSRRPVSLSSLLIARLLRLTPRRGPKVMGAVKRDTLDVPRWALTLAIVLFLVVFLTMLLLFVMAQPAHASSLDTVNFDKPSKDWYQGPVRYIITKVEVKSYKALDTDAERATFIDWFWQRRDPDPSTPENEFRNRFEQRVLESQRKFAFTTTPGWKTDMGKIYILVGPPDEINSDFAPQSSRGTMIWVYRKPPFKDMNPNTVIGFARGVDGEFRLSTAPTTDSDVARGLSYDKQNKTTYDGQKLVDGIADPALLAAGAPLSQTGIDAQMVYARIQRLPPDEEEKFKSFVSTRESYGTTIPMEVRIDYFKADGATAARVTVGIRSTSVQFKLKDGADIPDVGVFGKLEDKEHPENDYPFASGSGFVEGPNNNSAGIKDLLIFQAVGAVKPGHYKMRLGVEDRVSHIVSSMVREVDVPDLSGSDLTLSSITIADAMDPGDYATTTAKPFQMGKFRIVPRPDNMFSKKDELNVYCQVYNPALDATTGKPRMDVSYGFRHRLPDGTSQQMGVYRVADSSAQVHGYAVPLEKWPDGSYVVTVTILDKVAQKSVSADAVFTIRP
jgi:GWxTD domain-containing protein